MHIAHRIRSIVPPAFALFVMAMCLPGCSRKKTDPAALAVQDITVTTTPALGRQVPVTLTETGSFVAEELSEVAPAVAGRVFKTPVSIGAFVKTGQVICELDHRDADLKLMQTRAQLAEAMAAVRQAQSRIGLGAAGFEPTKVPEVAAARATYESSEAQARLAAADAKRYANLVATGDVSQSVYDKQRTQAETAAAQANGSRQQYEAAINTARQSHQAVGFSEATTAATRDDRGERGPEQPAASYQRRPPVERGATHRTTRTAAV